MNEQMKSSRKFIDSQEEKLGNLVQKKVHEKVEFMLNKYDAVYKSFKKFFNSDELFKVLE